MKKPKWVKGVQRWLHELRVGHFWFANLIALLLIMLILVYGAVWWSTPSGQSTAPTDLGKSIPWLVFGTLSAAIVGLFKDAIVRLIWFPDLDLVFDDSAPYCDDPPTRAGFPSIWFRPLVINRGSARAAKVELRVTDVHKPLPIDEGKWYRQYSMNLGWSNLDGTTVLDGLN